MSGSAAGGLGTPADERGRVIAAFVELVAERGFQGADRTSVCERAGLGRRAFERHFPDRIACFVAAWSELEEGYMGRVLAAYERPRDWRDQLYAAAAETVQLVQAHPVQARFLVVEALSLGEPGRERQRLLMARLERLLDRVREQLDDPAAPPPATASWVLGVFFDRVFRGLSNGAGAGLPAQLPQLMFVAVSAFGGTAAGLAELRKASPCRWPA